MVMEISIPKQTNVDTFAYLIARLCSLGGILSAFALCVMISVLMIIHGAFHGKNAELLFEWIGCQEWTITSDSKVIVTIVLLVTCLLVASSIYQRKRAISLANLVHKLEEEIDNLVSESEK